MNKQEFIARYGVDRRGTDSLKWDALEERFGDPNLLAMWVADMDFKVADSITEALQKRVDHGVYGYTVISDKYYQVFSDWMEKHFDLAVPKEWVRFSAGVVQAIFYVIKSFTQVGDSVIIQTPVYYPFRQVAGNTNRKLVECPLSFEDGEYKVNYDLFEKMIVDNDVKLYIHCSPHNPLGIVWDEASLIKLFDICQKHGVLVLSDEIHQDFIFGERAFIPALKLAGGRYQSMVISATSASKTFNLASFTHSHILIADEGLREQYDKYMVSEQDFNANVMSVVATQAAYEGGQEWLNHIKAIVLDNYHYMKDQLATHLPEVTLTDLEGTYLLLLDLNPILGDLSTKEFIQDRCRLAIDYGEWFGDEYTGFVRINLATLPKYVQQATERIIKEAERLKTDA